MKNQLTPIIGLIECKCRILREFLFRIAMGDGILSSEEIDILISIDLNLDLLQYAVIKAFEDNIIDEYENKELERIIKQIEEDAISTAKLNDCISHDERLLIRMLQVLLLEYQKILLR